MHGRLKRSAPPPHSGPQIAGRRDAARHVFSVNVRGATSPLFTSSHVQGADTGAPGFGRTAYAAANVAL